MKTYAYLIAFSGLLGGSIHAQDACDKMLLATNDDAELHYLVVDKKGKETGKMRTKVILIEETDKGTIIHFETCLTPNKGARQQLMNTYSMRCFQDTLFMSMKSALPLGMLENYQSMQVDMEGKDLAIPAKVVENMELPDGNLKLTVSSNGMKVVSINANTSKRKVEKMESVTVPAGTFECVKIQQSTEVKIGLITNKSTTSIWYAPGTGVVKSESYDKKGALESRAELQKQLM